MRTFPHPVHLMLDETVRVRLERPGERGPGDEVHLTLHRLADGTRTVELKPVSGVRLEGVEPGVYEVVDTGTAA